MAQAPPAGLEIRRVDRSREAVMRNLLELYCHDMAEWFLLDAGEDGRYSYPAEKVWNDQVDVYLASLGAIPIAFALVGPAEPFGGAPGAKDLDELFVVRRHRRGGIGKTLAADVWDRYPGRWLVRVYQGNPPALAFWREVVADHTRGAFREETRSLSGRSWSYFSFDRSTRPLTAADQ
jgi:predicted acetyltransferase